MAMVNHAVGDRHCGYRREGGKPGDHERIGPVDTGRGSGCLDEDRVSRPDAERTRTIVRTNHDSRGNNRPDAERTRAIVRTNHDGRGNNRPDAERTGTIIRTVRPQCGWRERCHHRQHDDPDEELRNCHGDHFLAPATDPGGRRQGNPPALSSRPTYHRPRSRHIRDYPAGREGFHRHRTALQARLDPTGPHMLPTPR